MKNTEEDEESQPLSQLEIEELITTKFVTSSESQGFPNVPNVLNEVDKLEKARAVGSPLQISPIENPDGDYILEEYESCLSSPALKKLEDDHTVILLDRIRNASEEILKEPDFWDTFRRSKKWAKTSRVTELALVNALISLVDARPSHLHIFFHHLTDSDVFDILNKAITNVEKSPTKYRSLFRISLETEMTFKDFIDGIDVLTESQWTFKVSHPIVASYIHTKTGDKVNMMTNDILSFIELEDKKCKMETLASFEITIIERPHVKVNLEYHSEFGKKSGKLERTIVIEQWVDSPDVPPARRATFGEPLIERVEEFEIDQVPVCLPPKGLNLIRYLDEI